MSDASALTSLRLTRTRNQLRAFGWQSKFKISIIMFASTIFWVGLYFFFSSGLRFLKHRVGAEFFEDLVGNLLYLFFFFLTVMLLISNAIICYSSFYKSRETGFLLTKPLKTESIFLYKFLESLGFSSWALLFLATPMMVAYGRSFDVPWTFYPLSIIFFAAFMWIPAVMGSAVVMLLTNFLPNLRRRLMPLAVLAAIVIVMILAAKIIEFRSKQTAEIRFVLEIFNQIEWSKNPFLPSAWVTKGIIELARGPANLGSALFFFGVIVANGAFGLTILYSMSRGLLRHGWFIAHGRQRTKKIVRSPLDPFVRRSLAMFSPEIRNIVLKDIKSFVRDPVRWSEFLIFFGLLAVYFLNLRTFGYESRDAMSKLLISQMNLIATALVLSTFASRFIFPQLSLEGRRFWVLGTMPMKRETVLYGKMAFAFVSSLLISETLIGISSVMLRLPLITAVTHALVLLGVCLGLSGMAAGLGAVYPNFKEENPSKIVAGFGGTLNLVCNLIFVLVCVVMQLIPVLMYGAKMANIAVDTGSFKIALVISLIGVAIVSLLACMIPMTMGLKALRRLEI